MSRAVEVVEEEVEHDEFPPRIGHLSDDPARKIALCGTRILGITAYQPYLRCVVCFDIRSSR